MNKRTQGFLIIGFLMMMAPVLNACSVRSSDKTQQLKPRLVVLTDIAPNDVEPDDMESLIRLLVHADQFEVEALIATTGWSNTGGSERIDLIYDALDAYEKDLPNLKKRSGQLEFDDDESKQRIGYWPSADYLRSRTVLGSIKMGMKHIGEGNNSKGSNLIVELADENDDRPVWIAVWGGGNTFAQAIWKVQHERTQPEFIDFLHKFRVYTITDQDRPWSQGDTINYAISSHQWMRKFGKDLLFFWDECAWKHQNNTGKNNWHQYAQHIQGHGNLGTLYPKYKWGVEGDTPSFMHLMPNGLSSPDIPEQVSWSGYFEFNMGRDSLTRAYTNYTGEPYRISTRYFEYFYPAMFNNFAARMDWAKNGEGNINPVVLIDDDATKSVVEIQCEAGSKAVLDASKSYDPDDDKLNFKWWILPEAGSYRGDVKMMDADSERATVFIPSGAQGAKIHVICELADNGEPALTSYRRIIIEAR